MFFQLLGAGISAYASIQAGKAREDAARMDAFNTETEREQGEVLALQQAASIVGMNLTKQQKQM